MPGKARLVRRVKPRIPERSAPAWVRPLPTSKERPCLVKSEGVPASGPFASAFKRERVETAQKTLDRRHELIEDAEKCCCFFKLIRR